MFLRQLRWIVAGLAIAAAVCANPARSKADVQILVEELDASNNPIAGLRQLTTAKADPVTGGVSYNFTKGSYFTGGGTVTTSSIDPTAVVASLTPGFTGRLTSAYFAGTAAGFEHKLRITVTDDAFTTGNQMGTLKNDAASSSGFQSGTVMVDTFSRIFDPALAAQSPLNSGMPGPFAASNPTLLADGFTVAGPTNTASAVATANSSSVTGKTEVGVASLPSPYAIQQQIVVSFSGPVSGSTFSAGGGASLLSETTPAVPAPGGLVLGLIALPLLGLRRALRTRAAV